MKRYNILLVTGLILLFFPQLKAQNESDAGRNSYLQMLTRQALSEVSFSQKELNDELSEVVFDNYLKSLDYYKRFLIQADIDTLNYYKLLVDDQIRYVEFDLYELSCEIIDARIAESSAYYPEILSHPFDYSINEEIEIDRDKIDWAKDEADLKERWRKVLKYETLTRIFQEQQAQEKAMEKSDTVVEKPFDTLEFNARKSVLKRYKNWYNYMNQLDRSDRLGEYLNAYVSAYDPHTSYYPPKDKEDFDIRFSGQLEGIGATLSARDGYITVVNIVPGSPSWKQGELEVDDKILEVAQGDLDPVNIVDMRVDKAVKYIRGKKGSEVRLTVKKMDGTQTIIPIIRDVVVIEETYAKSLILEDSETGKRIGYIMLPSFYADFHDSKGPNCARDMQVEVNKLKEEKVDGIIIDLRNNGGGSLPGANEIAGLFIDRGPVVQVKPRNEAPTVYKDYLSGSVYDGPLVVMVNASSASASEILAAALQDYKRAVIIGGNSTFGKGTVQRFIDYDAVSNRKEYSPLGALKITIQKFYRINGGSTQLKGVTPDIILPDNYKYIDYGEREYDNPLAWSEVKPSDYTVMTENIPVFKTVVQESVKRTETDTIFQAINENALRLKKYRDRSEYPLNYTAFGDYKDAFEEESSQFDFIGKDTLAFTLATLPVDIAEIESDTVTSSTRSKWIKSLNKDIYLFEAMKVVEDIAVYSDKIKK